MNITTQNPATEEQLETYECLTEQQIAKKIDDSYISFCKWRKIDFNERKSFMNRLATLMADSKHELAKAMANEMGKPISQGLLEIEKCHWAIKHFAQNAEGYLNERSIETDFLKTTVYYEPLGIVFAIMPWNYPFWQVIRFAIPALMAGNSVILKHAEIVSGCALLIEELFRKAGFLDNIFQTFIMDSSLAPAVIAHDKVRAVTLTGSERAGKSVASNAGLHVKKVVLELGGSDPYIVLADADLDLAAKLIVSSRLNNTGQVCIAAKRAIIVEKVYDATVNKILAEINTYKFENPLNPQSKMGPMAREDLRESLHKQVLLSIKQGGELLTGGKIPQGKGYYYPPTVIANVKPGMCAFDEELFGPVLAVSKAKDEQDAIKLANMSKYGLGACVFTKDLKRGEDIARYEIEAGSAFVNAVVSSDPRVPFGGIKHSGFGRELSMEGIKEFVNVKTVSVNK